MCESCLGSGVHIKFVAFVGFGLKISRGFSVWVFSGWGLLWYFMKYELEIAWFVLEKSMVVDGLMELNNRMGFSVV